MKKLLFIALILVVVRTAFSQTAGVHSEFNFDFENVEKGSPTGWNNFGSSNYLASLDSTHAISGKYSAIIEFKEGVPNFKAWAFIIPGNYAGKRIKLTGYLKTESVNDGYAGLWMRIDPSVAFNNMSKNGVRGSTDWTKYEIVLDMNPEKTRQIVVGGLLTGKGKMWVDDLKIIIDKKDIHKAKLFDKKLLPADKDKEFDNGSLISIKSVETSQIDNLKTLGLIWGFLKYYHPHVARGKLNWDYELFRVLPKVISAQNKIERDETLVNWIKSIGEFATNEQKMDRSLEAKLEPDLDWIEDINLSAELTFLLLKIKIAKRTNNHYYIGLHQGVGNPDFKNENAYASMKFPDDGFRLLALYRYWNIIQYYFPYKYLIEEDWVSVLEEFIPKVIEATNKTEYSLAILELIARVHDTHANIWGGNQTLAKHFGQNYSVIELAFIENSAIVTGYYDNKLGQESGLEIGDVIFQVNGRPVEEIIRDMLKYTPASNYPTQLRDIAPKLLRTNDSIINVVFSRNGIKRESVLKAFSSKEINVYHASQTIDTCFRIADKNIALINNGSLKREHLDKIWEAVKSTDGLIIDIRNYPTDFPIYELSNYLMPKSTPFAKFTNGSIKYPGLFTFTKPINAGKKNKNYYKGKVIILVNEVSQSSAEFHAMAYRAHPNSIVIGSTTAGADGNVSQFYLPGGISTMISGIGVYYPDGKETQRAGIIPDIEAIPTIKGIKEGKDELLEKAIEIINEQ